MCTIRVDVPGGTTAVTADFAVALENTISDRQLLLAWNTVLLYPLDTEKTQFTVGPSVILPAGWKQGSSLQVTQQSADRVDFAPLTLERLIDSPVLAGEFFRSVPLTSTWPAVLDVTADSAAALDRSNEAHAFARFSTLIDEDRAMFGFRHWDTFHVLVSQSDADPYDGLEHSDSPYNAIEDAGLAKASVLETLGAHLLAHEQSHAWIGKYPAPRGSVFQAELSRAGADVAPLGLRRPEQLCEHRARDAGRVQRRGVRPRDARCVGRVVRAPEGARDDAARGHGD